MLTPGIGVIYSGPKRIPQVLPEAYRPRWLIILVQHLLVIGGHKAAGGHQCKAQTRSGDMGVEGSLCNCIQEVRSLAKSLS